MKPFERSPSIRLLGALPLAWASSAALVLADDALIFAALGLVWLGLASRWLAGRRTAIARRALALLIAAAVPAQGFAAAAIEVSGPAHFHAPAKIPAAHWHSGVMHHHHAEGDAVVVDDGKRQAPSSGEGKRIAFGAVDALAASARALLAPLAANQPAPACIAEPARHTAHPPERPPRLLRISLPI
jgi:hypothetical protein